MNLTSIETRVLTARHRPLDSGLEVMTYERTERPDQLALEDRLTPEQRQRAQEFARRIVWNLPERGTIEGGVKAMNKKLMPKPAGTTMETRRPWTYATLRPPKAWMLGPRSLPKSRAIYHPKSGKRSEQPRERGDAQVRPLLCYPLPVAPLS